MVIHECVKSDKGVHISTITDSGVPVTRFSSTKDWVDVIVPAFVAGGASRERRGRNEEAWIEPEVV